MTAPPSDTFVAHDYQLEPPDEVIAELQSDVVQLRLRGESLSGDPRCAVSLAALAVLFRMHSEAA